MIDPLHTIENALDLLDRNGLPTRNARERLAELNADYNRQPSESDLRHLWAPPEQIAEHLRLGNDRATLSCALMKGRAYSLTPAQRDVIRDQFNMTPAPLVEVLEIVFFWTKHPGTEQNPTSGAIRRVVLRSCEHIDPRRRAVINKFTIDRWGDFCDRVAQRQAERDEAREATQDDESKTPKKATKPSTKSVAALCDEYAV